MKDYDVISIDMFQTLVNIESRKEYIWKRILKYEYSKELENKYVSIVNKKIVDNFHRYESCSDQFRNLKEIFLDNFTQIFKQNNLNYCPVEASKVFIEEHMNSEIYSDSLEFVKRVKKKYKVCLVSDADIEMVKEIVGLFKFDKVFISEEIKSYKRNSDSKMFNEVITHYKVRPERILHIGDSSSDIIGASRLGIDTCWINRHNYNKRFSEKPKYEVKSLVELIPILEI